MVITAIVPALSLLFATSHDWQLASHHHHSHRAYSWLDINVDFVDFDDLANANNNEVDLAAVVAADEEGKGAPTGGGSGADAAVANE